MVSSSWAIPRISQILPLDEESLQQILDYASTLSKPEAAEHLKGILGDSPQALEFISHFNSQREASDGAQVVPATSTSNAPSRKPRKKKAPLNNLPPPRVPEDYGNTGGAYSKKEEEDYISGARRSRKESPAPNAFKLSETPVARQMPTAKPPPSALGPLISDLPNVRTSHASSSASKTKIHVSGGSSMHGASTTLQDLVRASMILSCPAQLTHMPGLRHPYSGTPNQPIPLIASVCPSLRLPCNTTPTPDRRSELSQLRKDHLRKGRRRPVHLLLTAASLVGRHFIDDPCLTGRAWHRKDIDQ